MKGGGIPGVVLFCDTTLLVLRAWEVSLACLFSFYNDRTANLRYRPISRVPPTTRKYSKSSGCQLQTCSALYPMIPFSYLLIFSPTSCCCTMCYRVPVNYLFIRPPSGLRWNICDRLRDNYPSAHRPCCAKSDGLPGPSLNPANTQAFHPPPSKPLTPVLAPRFSFLHTFFHSFLRSLF